MFGIVKMGAIMQFVKIVLCIPLVDYTIDKCIYFPL